MARLAMVLASATCAILALGAAPAFAATTRHLVASFGSLGSGAGQFQNPQNIAIDQSTGDLYVVDSGNNRIDKFDASGNFILAFGKDVDQTTGGDVCTASSGDTCQAGTPGSAPGEFTAAFFVAVDNSAGASAGDVYVGDTGDNLVSKFDSSGKLVTTWGTGGQLSGSTSTTFGPLAGITVDAAGNLLVVDQNSTQWVFAQNGTFTSSTPLVRGTFPNGAAVDTAGNFFKVNGDGSVQEFDSTGNDIGTVTPDQFTAVPIAEAAALAIEPASGDLYVVTSVEQDTQGNLVARQAIDHYAFNGSGQVIEPDGSTCTPVLYSGCNPTDTYALPFPPSGVAVSSASGDAYVADPSSGQIDIYQTVIIPDVTSNPASGVGPTSATLNGHADPAGGGPITSCEFEYVDDAGYNASASDPYSAGQTVPCAPPAPYSSPTDVSATIMGLTAGTAYHYRLVAGNANGTNFGSDVTFQTPPPPSIDSATATNVAATSVDLNAQINPNGFDTTYRFEYGTTTSYGSSVPVPDADIGSGTSDVAVTQHVTGLSANTTYHWRILATNQNGTSGATTDHTFIYDTTGPGLPDNRAYELVTPPQKNAALIGDVAFGAPPLVALDGSRVIASSIQCFADASSCNAESGGIPGNGSLFAFSRTASGWQATALDPPASEFPLITPRDVSADAGTALFTAPTQPAGESDFYAREADGTVADVGPITPPSAGAHGSAMVGLEYATADLSHVVWQQGLSGSHAQGSGDPATDWPFDPTDPHGSSVYEYVGAGNPQPRMVAVSGGAGSTDPVSACGAALGAEGGSSDQGALSTDGATVYFTALGHDDSNCQTPTALAADAVYARIDGARTVAISARSAAGCTGACQTSPPADADFVGASADGSRAYFLSTQQLTDDASEDGTPGDGAVGNGSSGNGCAATTGPNGCNLYLYDFSKPAGHELTAVSAGDTSGGGPRVRGVVAVSQDGSHAYFVAQGVLTTAPNAEGQTAADGADNLYSYDAASGQTAFIATMPASDSEEWTPLVGQLANVTPDGRYLVFLSHADLTPDDASQSGAWQVFRYDAQTGALARISIGNDGFDDNGNRPSASPCSPGGVCSEDAQLVGPRFSLSGRTDPTMSDDGAYVFFMSPVALTPHALDDFQIGVDASNIPIYAQNVYEYHDGHVYLISDGRDTSIAPHGQAPACTTESAVCLLGTDATGQNVFFSTVDQLVPQDTDTELDYYDARVGGGFPFTSPTACTGDTCQGAQNSQPPPPTAASVTFSGPGNAKPGAASAKVRVLSKVVHGPNFFLRVKVPGTGRIAVTAAGIRAVHRSVSKAGTYKLKVTLTPQARRALARKHRLKLKLGVTYTPGGGAASTATVWLTVKPALRHNHAKRARPATSRNRGGAR